MSNNPKKIDVNCKIFKRSLKYANLEKKNPSPNPITSMSIRKKQLQITFTAKPMELTFFSAGNSSFISKASIFMMRINFTAILYRLYFE